MPEIKMPKIKILDPLEMWTHLQRTTLMFQKQTKMHWSFMFICSNTMHIYAYTWVFVFTN